MSARALLLLVPSELERSRLRLPGPGVEGAAGAELLVCGVGLAAAAATCAARLAAGGVERCVLVGLAGTRDPQAAPPGALVAGRAVRNEAVGAGHGATFLDASEMGLPPADALPDLLALAPPGARVPAAAGVIGTVAAASASPEEAAQWRARHPDVLVEEMEGWAVALACRRAGVPLTILRAVSNVAGDRDRRRWELPRAFAALQAALDAELQAGVAR